MKVTLIDHMANFIAQEIDKKCSKLFPVSWKYLVQVKKIPPEKTAE